MLMRDFESKPDESVLTRFLTHIHVADNGCWLWDGRKNGRYGVFTYQGQRWTAHRWAYIYFKGPIVFGVIDHLCSNKSCCNPDHLEMVSWKENTKRAWQRKESKWKPRTYQRKPDAWETFNWEELLGQGN